MYTSLGKTFSVWPEGEAGNGGDVGGVEARWCSSPRGCFNYCPSGLNVLF
jgi:hypothetical protein